MIWWLFRIQGDDRENEIEDNLQAIDCMVSNLRNMAVDMSAEISDQNEQLERITLKVKGRERKWSGKGLHWFFFISL